jgi:hypothetical protein
MKYLIILNFVEHLQDSHGIPAEKQQEVINSFKLDYKKLKRLWSISISMLEMVHAGVTMQKFNFSIVIFRLSALTEECLSCKLMKPCILWLILSQGEILQWMNSSFIVVYSTLFEIVLYLIEKMFQAILLFITFETTVTYLYLDWKG